MGSVSARRELGKQGALTHVSVLFGNTSDFSNANGLGTEKLLRRIEGWLAPYARVKEEERVVVVRSERCCVPIGYRSRVAYYRSQRLGPELVPQQ